MYWWGKHHNSPSFFFFFFSRSSLHSKRSESGYSVKVTRSNFGAEVDGLKKQLEDADFVALHLEASGVASAPWRSPHPLDSPHSLYSKLTHSAQTFSLWRFGLCLFKWTPLSHSFLAYPYSFYLFPRNELNLKNVQDKFLCQKDYLELLSNRGFDFNACVNHGISYLSKEFEAAARARICYLASEKFPYCIGTRTQIKSSPNYISDLKFSRKVRDMIQKWLDSLPFCPVNKAGALAYSSYEQGDIKSLTTVSTFESSGGRPFALPSFVLKKKRGYEVNLVVQVVNDHFNNIVPVIHADPAFPNHKDVHLLYAGSETDKTKLMEELDRQKLEEQEKQLAEAIGFRHVVDAIIASKKIVVGHDSLLDFAHIFSKFLAPLPPCIVEFAKSIEKLFPCSFDTNYIAKVHPQLKTQGSTKLSEIYRSVMENYVKNGMRYNVEIARESQERHNLPLTQVLDAGCLPDILDDINDTGFDAYMAGVIFSYVCSSYNIEPEMIHHLPEQMKSGLKRELAQYANFLCWEAVTSNVPSLARGESVMKAPSADFPGCDLILIWGFPYGISTAGIEAMIQKIIADTHLDSIKVFPVDSSSAFAKFRYHATLEKFMKLVQRTAGEAVEVGAVPELGIRAARFTAYEDLCKSSVAMHQLSDIAEVLKLGFSEEETEDFVTVTSNWEQGL